MEIDDRTSVADLDAFAAADGETLAFLFHRAVRAMMRAHHHQGHASHAQMHVLAILRQAGAMNQRELIRMLNVRSASLSELLGKLEGRGLITRIGDERDRRNVVVSITEQGAAAVKGAKDARQRGFDAVFGALSENERGQLAKLLRKVVASLAGASPQQGENRKSINTKYRGRAD
ncbi:MAG: MarR family transcriptional regulator [Desulfovibrio sp.]|jgi:DNA-binding MarR family transcriptional regulator|nr:MarR family transcriptional regulator [Desulfovibrio sp.]